jgi:peptide/nickel transport system substrate-binding protein
MKTLSLILSLLSFLFCSQEIPEFEKQSLKISLPTDPITLDPIHSTDLVSEKIVRMLHSGLFQLSSTGKIQGKLARTWEWKNNNSLLIIHLVDGINSEEVKTSLEKLLNQPGSRKESYKNFLGISTENNPSVLKIKMDPLQTTNQALTLLSLPASYISSNTGPYLLKNWKKGNFLDLEYNPRYEKLFPTKTKSPRLPKHLRILIIPQSTSGIFLFAKKQLHSMKLTDFLLNHPITKENYILSKKGRSVQYVAINFSNPCFDRNFREAVNLSIQREKIISKILENQAELTLGSIPLSRFNTEFLNLNINEFLPKTNLTMAKEILKTSKCYPEITNQVLEFRMRSDDENQSKGKAVLENLKSLGLNLKMVTLEKTTLYKENGLGLGDLTFLTWYGDYESPMAFLNPLFLSTKTGNAGNRAFYKNKEMDKAIEQENILESLKLLKQDKPWIFLWSIQENYLLSESILPYSDIVEYL